MFRANLRTTISLLGRRAGVGLSWLGLALMSLPGHGATMDKAGLRQLAHMPQININVNYTVTDFDLYAPYPNHSREANIALLRSQLQKTPGDANLAFRLSRLYQNANDDSRAKEFLVQSLKSYSRSLEGRPNDGILLAKDSNALFVAGRDEEALAAARKAVAQAPRAWQAWTYLSQATFRQAAQLLLGKDNASPSFNFVDPDQYQKYLDGVMKNKPTPAQVAQSESLRREAREDLQRAIALAPRQPDPYVVRFNTNFQDEIYIQGVLQRVQGKPAPAITSQKLLALTAGLVPVGRLLPDDVNAVTLAAFFPLLTAQMSDPTGQGSPLWSHVSDADRGRVQSGLDRLAILARSPDARTAAAAEAARGFLLNMGLRRSQESETDLRHALALDPSCDRAWDALTLLLVSQKRYADIVTLYTSRVKIENTANNHLLLAKASDALHQPAQAEAEVQAALKLAPDDPTDKLALAVLLLRRSGQGNSQDDSLLRQVGQILKDIYIPVTKLASPQLTTDYNLDSGIYLALTNSLPDANTYLNTVLQSDSNNTDARQALAIVNDAQRPTP